MEGLARPPWRGLKTLFGVMGMLIDYCDGFITNVYVKNYTLKNN